jgi:predicted membrane GTPase involved in stress response
VEVTPDAIRLRKVMRNESDRKAARNEAKRNAEDSVA